MKDLTIKDLVYLIIIFVLIYLFTKVSVKQKDIPDVKPVDTAYNRITIDSIEYNIIKRDSIIYNFKDSIVYELEIIKHSGDTATIMQFQKLLSD